MLQRLSWNLRIIAPLLIIGCLCTAPEVHADGGDADVTAITRWRRLREGNFYKKPLRRLAAAGERIRRMLFKRPKVVTATEAARLLQPGEAVSVPVGHQVAKSVLRALSDRAADPKGGLNAEDPIRLVGLANTGSRKIFDRGGRIVPDAIFVGANSRDPIAAGRGAFRPVYLHRVPELIREGQINVDTALIQVSPPDRLGYVSLGASVAVTPAAMDAASRVIAEVNPNVPRTRGASRVHISQIDYVVHSDKKQNTLPEPKLGDVEKAIAKHIVKLIPKRPTLQFGIGGIPDAVAGALAQTGRKDLHVFSEMISDGVMNLVKAGAVKGKVIYSFAMGSEKFVKWLGNNRKLLSAATENVNDPAKLGKIPRLVSVNSAIRVDLKGQANAQFRSNEWYSGVGGQVDFFRGAMASKGGRAIMALPATATVRDEHGREKKVSRIVAELGDEDVVTTGMHDIQYVVTEYGVARLDGRTAVARARALIKIAAPEFREELYRELERDIKERKSAEKARYDRHRQQREARAAEAAKAQPAKPKRRSLRSFLGRSSKE